MVEWSQLARNILFTFMIGTKRDAIMAMAMMTFNSGLTGFSSVSDCPSGPRNGRWTYRGRKMCRHWSILFQFAVAHVTIVPLKNAWQEKQGTRRSCIAMISVSTTCRLNYFRKWRPFESRTMPAVSRTTRRDKQKFGDTREKTHNIGSRFIMRALTLPFNELRFT